MRSVGMWSRSIHQDTTWKWWRFDLCNHHKRRPQIREGGTQDSSHRWNRPCILRSVTEIDEDVVLERPYDDRGLTPPFVGDEAETSIWWVQWMEHPLKIFLHQHLPLRQAMTYEKLGKCKLTTTFETESSPTHENSTRDCLPASVWILSLIPFRMLSGGIISPPSMKMVLTCSQFNSFALHLWMSTVSLSLFSGRNTPCHGKNLALIFLSHQFVELVWLMPPLPLRSMCSGIAFRVILFVESKKLVTSITQPCTWCIYGLLWLYIQKAIL